VRVACLCHVCVSACVPCAFGVGGSGASMSKTGMQVVQCLCEWVCWLRVCVCVCGWVRVFVCACVCVCAGVVSVYVCVRGLYVCE